jgi:hypothetical protein
MNEKKARIILERVGRGAIDGFLGACPGAVRLRSKEPAACWEWSGFAHYIVLSEFTGPNANDDPDAPLLFRIRVNEYPPPALHHYLKPKGAKSLKVADSPCLNVFARAREVSELGAWVACWHRSWCQEDPQPPEPPVKLVAEVVRADLSAELLDFTALGEAWRQQTYVWTRRARRVFEPWFKGE